MSYHFRHRLARMLLESLEVRGAATPACCADQLTRLLYARNATRSLDVNSSRVAVPELQLGRLVQLEPSVLREKLRGPNIAFEKRDVLVKVEYGPFAKSIIQDVMGSPLTYGHGYESHKYLRTRQGLLERSRPERVLVEFGSPNVAKPLHAGHLRSALIGQFVANINQVLGNSVIKMNYLGDWGTQFGLLAVGFQRFGSEGELEGGNAIGHLLEIYVKVNQLTENEGLGGPTYTEALDFMRRLENRESEATKLWQRFRISSLKSSRETFTRLGISFDETAFESDYVESSRELCRRLEERGLLQYDRENVGFIQSDKTKIILKKSDDTSLYLSRDLAAILKRVEVHNFDRIHYVVDSGQSLHFQKMRKVLELLDNNDNNNNNNNNNNNIINRLAHQENLHVPFGRVKGMSTRKGSIVQLNDILDEAKQRMMEIMNQKSTTKTQNTDHVAENLGLSAVYVQDLKEKRQKDYDFNWERMLSNKGATGPFLQYGHARLCSLERSFSHYLTMEADFDLLRENEALRLVQHLAKFDQTLNECYHTLEPHTLVHYLLDLVTFSNNALEKLSIKNSPVDVASVRLQMFHSTRLVLSNGIRIVGLEPLHEM